MKISKNELKIKAMKTAENLKNTSKSLIPKISIAPMMDWTAL